MSLEVTHKFDIADWHQAEKIMPKYDINVLDTIISYVSNNKISFNENIFVLGDELYLYIRDLIKDYIPEREIKTNKSKTQRNKKETIIYENSKKKIKEIISNITITFKKEEFFPYIGLKSNIIEIRGVSFLYIIYFVNANYSKLKHKKYLPFILAIIIGIKKFITSLCDYKNNSFIKTDTIIPISNEFVSDLSIQFTSIEKKFNYDGFMIYDYAPELLIYTDYDHAIPQQEIKLRKNQTELMEIITSNFDNGFVIGYISMISSGKTTMSIGVAQFINIIRQTKQLYSGLELIFCCNLLSVKNQVARLCYNSSIKFGIGYIHSNGHVKIINHYSCKKDDERSVIICSPDVAYKLLSTNYNPEKYILFLDEPTIGADIKDSKSLEDNIKLMNYLPKWSILSSATLPDINKLSNLFLKITDKYKNLKICQIYSNEIQIGCDLKTYDNNIIVPFTKCKSKDDLEFVLLKIEQNPFLGRLLTYNIIKTLWIEMNNAKISDIPNIPAIFSDISNLSAEKVRLETLNLLKILLCQADNVIENVCKMNIQIQSSKKNNEEEEEDNIKFGIAQSNDDDAINFNLLGTTQAYRFLNMSLIVTNDPLDFALENFKPLISDLIENGCKSAKHIINSYKREVNAYKNMIDKVGNNKNISGTKIDKDKKIQELEEENKPKINFPEFGQINTVSHIAKYASSHANKIIKRFVRIPNDLNELPEDIYVIEDTIVLLLFCGVGVYCPSNNKLNDIYNTTILHMASEGKLAYLIANNAIAYGTNYPINRVFVLDDFSKIHSLNTLFQLLGRAGRVGQSWKAEAFISEDASNKLIEYIKGNISNNIELDNILDMFNKVNTNEDSVKKKYIDSIKNKILRSNIEKPIIDDKILEVNPKKLAQEWAVKYLKTGKVLTRVPIPIDNIPKITRVPIKQDVYVPPTKSTDSSWRRNY